MPEASHLGTELPMGKHLSRVPAFRVLRSLPGGQAPQRGLGISREEGQLPTLAPCQPPSWALQEKPGGGGLDGPLSCGLTDNGCLKAVGKKEF